MSASNNLYSVLAYNQNKVNESHAKVIFSSKMIENTDGKCDMYTCLQSFEPYLLANRNTEKPVLHVSINPDPKDRLSDEQLSDLAQEWMQKMGYGDQPFIVFKHEDIERKHVHIVSLRVDENGRKIDDKFEHRRSMDACRELERNYGLVPADQKQRQEGLPLKKVNYEKGDVKHQIANVIRPIAQSWHFQSLKEYRALLALYNINVEEVRGEVRGKAYKGLVYSALNEKSEKTGNPFKSSLFGKSVGMDALEKHIEKSAEIIKNRRLKERSKNVITSALRTTNNRADFEKALEKQGISTVFRANEQGRIYGATFIDNEQKCVFNGSRLGKEFSANVFNDLFSETDRCSEHYDKFKSEESRTDEPSRKAGDFEENSNFGGIFDFLSSGNTVMDEIEEQSFIRHLKKKQKRQRRIQ